METAQVGARTRARAALAMEAAAAAAVATSPEPSRKRRKINNNDKTSQDLKFSASSFVDQLKDIGGKETALPLPLPPAEEGCSDESLASCCSSNGSSGLDEEGIKSLDLEVQSSQAETSACNCGDKIRREMNLSSKLGTNSQELESIEKKPTAKANSRCVLSTRMKMPTELELEEFFAAAEKDIQKRFSDKYNYDIVKDAPLEGRYDWVKLNPWKSPLV